MINNPNTTLTLGLFVARFIDLDLHRHAKDESRSASPESSVASSVPLFPVPCRSSRWLAVTPTGWKHLLLFQSHRFRRTLESQMKRVFIPPSEARVPFGLLHRLSR